MRVNDLVHLGIGPNLEKVWELVLNFDQWATRSHLQHQSCIAKQRAVADRRYERVSLYSLQSHERRSRRRYFKLLRERLRIE